MSDKLWWQQPLTILAHCYEINQAVPHGRAAIERLVRWKLSLGFNAEHLFLNYTMLQGTGGDDAKAYLFKNDYGYQEDWLAEYLPIANKHGLRVIVYFNCHWFKLDTLPADYYTVDATGTPKVIYGDGGEVCARGPFRNWSEKMGKALGRYPIAGVFLDGPMKDTCWCPTCRAEFQTRFGSPMPDNLAKLAPDSRPALEDFLVAAPLGYLEAFARGLRKHNPMAILFCNGGSARQMRDSLPWTQMVGEEGGFIGYAPLSGEFPFNAGRAAKELECRARGRGRIVYCDCGFKKYDYHAHPKGEIARMYSGTIANGANVWFLPWRSALKSPGLQLARTFNRLICTHADSLANGESLAEAAILHSPLNVELAGAVQAASGDDVHKREALARRLVAPRHGPEFNGIYAALTRSGYSFDTVEEDMLLAGELPGRIKLLILPAVGAIGDPVAEYLRRFVARGGRLLATFDSGLFDEHGDRRANYALADVFGADLAGEMQGPSDLDYLAITGKTPLATGLSQALLPCPEHWWLVKAAPSAKCPVHYHEKMPRRYAALPPVSANPAVVIHKFGKGLSMFIPSSVGDLSLKFRFPDIRLLLKNAACLLAPPPVTVVGGDEFVETTLRCGANGAVVAHLINWASGERPASRAIPLGPLGVNIRLPAGFVKPRVARLAMAKREVRVTVKGRIASFVLPRLDEYEMAILQ
ncbi:MAG: beta-galactosidase trimerization domain-containing protein [Verrucomicrobia bacterium]|nr:beta-galactosidase trimerization domain-containing protein [Verrucomicrobiota bacterium]MBU1735052.1 beta-galactosidase trimerization domain-containing protein [Verrucomicrobiota bacterium]